MDSISLLYKQAGETPLSCLDRWKKSTAHDQHIPATYAGRLDPLAEGLLLILSGESVKQKEQFLHLDKKYTIDVLIGLTSDTGDVLGIPKKNKENPAHNQELLIKQINAHIPALLGTQKQIYPAYSSKPVNGKPLFWWARNNLLHTIAIPHRSITLFDLAVEGVVFMTGEALLSLVLHKISLVVGDFRQESICTAWTSLMEPYKAISFPIVRIHVHASSGAYMRTLAQQIGEKINQDALALSITRTAIGTFTLADIQQQKSDIAR